MLRDKKKPLVVSEIYEQSNHLNILLEDAFDAFILSKRAANCKIATLRFYKWQVTYFLDWLRENRIIKVSQLTSTHIRSYISEKLESRKQGGVYTTFCAIRTFMIWTWDEYYFDTPNPINKVTCKPRPKKPIPGIPIQYIDELLDACDGGRTPERDRAMIAILIDTGIRRRELADIRIGDVNLANGSILIRRGKSNLARTVYLCKKSRQLVRRYYETIDINFKEPEAPFWITELGEPLTITGMREILRRTQRRAGLKEYYSFHDFRRTFALEAWQNGADFYGVAELLGQINVSSTDRYIDASDDDRRVLHEKFSPMNKRRE